MIQRLDIDQIGYLWPAPGGIYNTYFVLNRFHPVWSAVGMCANALYECVPHYWVDGGMWCCSCFASVRLLESATSIINQSHIFSNRIPYAHNSYYEFCLGSGYL